MRASKLLLVSQPQRDLSRFVKAYDVRGTVPDQIDEDVARAFGAAFVRVLRTEGAVDEIVVAHDMRPSSPALARAFADGAAADGVHVVMAGLGSTDMAYFAAGSLNVPGAMFTASHNPAQYNGIKMCRAAALPIGLEIGPGGDSRRGPGDSGRPRGARHRSRRGRGPGPALRVRGVSAPLVDLSSVRPMKVVVDAGNGMAGYTVPAVLGAGSPVGGRSRSCRSTSNSTARSPTTRRTRWIPPIWWTCRRRCVEHGGDIGLAFDGDADRCFVIDESGDPVSPSAITALVASRELAKHPGATIIHNLITSSAVPEIITERGGHPVRTRVGHSYIKGEMARTGAVFGGEHSAHYYFKEFWGADTGMLAAMHVLAALGCAGSAAVRVRRGSTSVTSRPARSIPTVADTAAKIAEVAAALPGVQTDQLDGLTVRFDDGAWLNLRPSNTEPLLRLNVEGPTEARMEEVRDAALAIIRG